MWRGAALRRLILLGALLATALAVSAALSNGEHRPAFQFSRPPAAPRPARPARHPLRARTGAVGRVEQRLSPAQLAGQRIVYAYSGPNPPASLLSAIRAGEAAGVIFFGPNVTSAGQIRGVIGTLQHANASSPVHAPLLMLADQEGGEVRRLPGAPALSEKQIGQSASRLTLAGQAGRGAGRNLAAAGLNVNLAPVLDVFRRPGNFIDRFQRSYSSDPRIVAQLGGAFISAQQRTGVAATAKHFPGLGAAGQSQNTDLGPVTIDLSAHELRAVDEVPYGTAIADGVKLVMTSWAVYPALDPRLPAGLSARVIQRELRGRLGFRGVTITDGIDAGALRAFGTLAQRGVLAASAGADLILCAAPNVHEDTPADGAAVLAGIASALARGQLPRAAAEQAAARVIALRSDP